MLKAPLAKLVCSRASTMKNLPEVSDLKTRYTHFFHDRWVMYRYMHVNQPMFHKIMTPLDAHGPFKLNMIHHSNLHFVRSPCSHPHSTKGSYIHPWLAEPGPRINPLKTLQFKVIKIVRQHRLNYWKKMTRKWNGNISTYVKNLDHKPTQRSIWRTNDNSA